MRTGPNVFDIVSNELHRIRGLPGYCKGGGDLPSIHVFHAHYDRPRIVEERSMEVDNVSRLALVHDLQFADDPLADLLVGIDVYDLALLSDCISAPYQRRVDSPSVPYIC